MLRAGGGRWGTPGQLERDERKGKEREEGLRKLINIWRQEFHVLLALTEEIERTKGKRLPVYTRSTFGYTLTMLSLPPATYICREIERGDQSFIFPGRI
jgi:hypothetical protein